MYQGTIIVSVSPVNGNKTTRPRISGTDEFFYNNLTYIIYYYLRRHEISGHYDFYKKSYGNLILQKLQ